MTEFEQITAEIFKLQGEAGKKREILSQMEVEEREMRTQLFYLRLDLDTIERRVMFLRHRLEIISTPQE